MSRAERITLGFSVATGLALVAWMLLRMDAGLDLTDEGYYLNWISSPWDFATPLTQFGFVYHPFYELLGGDIVRLRQFNLLLTLGAAYVLCVTVVPRPALAFVLATSALAFWQLWLPTPNYNSLAFQALMLAVTGLLRPTRMGWILLGFGGGLLFLAKPTSAALLMLPVALYLWATRRWAWRGIALSAATAFGVLIVSALLIDGSLVHFVLHMQEGVGDIALLHAGAESQRIWRLDDWPMNSMLWQVSFGLVVVVAACIMRPRLVPCVGIAACIAAWCVMAAYVLPEGDALPYAGLVVLGPVVGALLISVRPAPGRASWVLALCFLALPLVYAFGSTNDYWFMAQCVGLFWVLAAAVVLAPHRPHALLPLAIVAQTLTVVLVALAMQHPYRQAAPLAAQQTHIAVRGTDLKVAPDIALLLPPMETLAQEAGFLPRQPLIDMSGENPLVAYMLNATPMPMAWTLGGYKGSAALLEKKLDAVGCAAFANSWVIDAPEGARRIPLAVLERRGMRLEKIGTVGNLVLYRAKGSTCEATHE